MESNYHIDNEQGKEINYRQDGINVINPACKGWEEFLKDFDPLEKGLNTLFARYGVKEGVTIHLKDGKVWAAIDVGQFR